MDMRPIRIERGLFEQMVRDANPESGVNWGEPDDEGFYTPSIWEVVHYEPGDDKPKPSEWQMWALLVLGLLIFGAVIYTFGRITA